jgi:hypothetical protein
MMLGRLGRRSGRSQHLSAASKTGVMSYKREHSEGHGGALTSTRPQSESQQQQCTASHGTTLTSTMAWWGSIPSDGGSATRPIVLFSDGVVPACPYLGGGGWRSSNACGYKMRESSTLYSQPMIGIPPTTASRRPHPITEDMTRLVESSWGMVALTRCLPKHTRRHCSPTPRCETRLQTWKSQDTHARDAPSQGNRVTGTHMRGLHNQPAPSDLHRDPKPPPLFKLHTTCNLLDGFPCQKERWALLVSVIPSTLAPIRLTREVHVAIYTHATHKLGRMDSQDLPRGTAQVQPHFARRDVRQTRMAEIMATLAPAAHLPKTPAGPHPSTGTTNGKLSVDPNWTLPITPTPTPPPPAYSVLSVLL